MKKILLGFAFWLHTTILIFWVGLFFFPKSLWPGKIPFHFYMTLVIFGHQILWGLLIMPWTKKFRTVCFLTTIIQFLRGYKISDPQNYNYYFSKEIFGRVGITVNYRTLNILAITILILVSIQYFFFR